MLISIMTGYIPPALRKNPSYIPKKLSIKVKPVEWTELKSKDDLMNEYQKKNIGKADSAWNEK